ncbi:MAG: class I tRNA ligase family protein [Flavobacteriales bacterium]
MSSYHFNTIETKWQEYWEKHKTFEAKNKSEKPTYYVLDMFPYPSGAGLHVGHPLGYIASDIFARYKRHQGFNVLHPQGYDSFGLPAEQYAIQTGQHPKKTTQDNIARYREQLDRIGFSFDWSREVRTSNPDYYKWTQWIFIQLFESWYCKDLEKALPISDLIHLFEEEGNRGINAKCGELGFEFSAEDWNNFSEYKQQKILLNYRLTYLAETEVNWCPQLGTVLANDEIVNGVSERGGFPIERKKMMQWSMRISSFAERLLQGLDKLDMSESLKETQRNWIGKSIGATVKYKVLDENQEFKGNVIEVFTTRPDTIFGVTFMVLAPEHELVNKITTIDQRFNVSNYITETAKKSERERQADVKNITGVFTGAYAKHPFTNEPIPIWVGDYVLASYGTGAVMSVPCGDQRDYDFAKHFKIPIKNIFKGVDITSQAHTDKEGTIITNSEFISGLPYAEASKKVIDTLEQMQLGTKKVNYRLRDAVFSRQRYWGEPFPVYYKDGLPQMIAPKFLPIELPEVEKYLPTETGEPPLGRASSWAWDTIANQVVSNEEINDVTIFPLELNTMPGWAGSSWYFFRYMDAHNQQEFASKKALEYWKNVDLYIGGSEHATGHLLYSRFWVKFLYDRGFLSVNEPFKKLINQGMILGESAFIYYIKLNYKVKSSLNVSLNFALDEKTYKTISSNNLEDFNFEIFKDHPNYDEDVNFSNLDKSSVHKNNIEKSANVPINFINNSNELDFKKAFQWNPNWKYFHYPLNSNGKYEVFREVEKMSKSKYNVVNPDDICEQYGADTLRMYEMFLGPLEQAKPWNTAGITGVHSFLKKFWRLYHTGDNESFKVTATSSNKESFKTLHKTIKKVVEDIENFSFNTSVSTFMIAVNELTSQKCTSKEILEPLVILISPYAPHIAEELWSKLGNNESISTASFPVFEEKYLVEDSKEYPISFNGKMRFKMELPLSLTKDEIETAVMAHEKTQHYLQGRTPNKVIIVPGKIVNIVG